MDRARVALISSFTIDKIEIGGSTYERVGGPAYYAGATLAMMGIEPVVVTSIGGKWLDSVKDLLEGLPVYRLYNIGGHCESVYLFYHRYDIAGRRYSEILNIGCSIDLDRLDPQLIAESSWLLVSPVYREIAVEALEKVARVKRVAVDLQGLSRRLEGRRVISSAENLYKYLDKIPRLSVIHLSSDDIQDRAVGDMIDLEVISPLTHRASATLYTIGSHGGFVYINRSDGLREIYNAGGASLEQGWYYIPPYHEPGVGDPTGCGDIFLASVIGFLAKGYDILEASVRASIVSGMRVSRGFPTHIDLGEVERAAAALERKVYKV